MSQKKNIFNMLYELETGTLIRYGIAYIGFIVILSLCIEGIFIFLYKNAFNRGEKLIKFKKDIELVINKKDALIKYDVMVKVIRYPQVVIGSGAAIAGTVAVAACAAFLYTISMGLHCVFDALI